jgi:hypothetical protein
MKRIFTLLLLGLSLAVLPVMAQDDEDIDERYLFVDANGNVIPHGSTVVRDILEQDAGGNDMISSGVFVKNASAPSNLYLKLHYEITQIDNGSYQLCFPMSCAYQNQVGNYTTNEGQVSGTQDILSEWFPEGDGVCAVVLTIETLTKAAGFPPSYIHSGTGPTITLKFVKGALPGPTKGDVNKDGEINIGDINYLIDLILSSRSDIPEADVNGDNEVNVADINVLIEIIMNQN